MIIRRWFAPRSKEFSTIVERVICNSSPLPSLLRETRETNRRGDETHQFFLRISSRAEFIGPTRNRFCRVRIEETGSQGWALCQGCHLTARTTLLFRSRILTAPLIFSLNRPPLLIIFHRCLRCGKFFTISSLFFGRLTF